MRNVLLFLHIGGAILMIGEILFSSLWLRASLVRSGEPGVTRYVLATMQFTGRAIAMPAMLVNLIAGIVLMMMGSHLMKAVWLLASIVLYTILSGLWHGGLIPLRKKMAAMIDGAGAGALPAEYPALAQQWVKVSGRVVALFWVILALMIAKPTLP